jgi:hypothetical protein
MTLESSNFDSVQSSGVQLEVVHVHEGPHMHVGRLIHHPQRLHDFVLKVAKVVVEPTNYTLGNHTSKLEWLRFEIKTQSRHNLR